MYTFWIIVEMIIIIIQKNWRWEQKHWDEDYCTFSQLFLLDFFLFLINIVGCDPKEVCNIFLKEIHFKTCLIFEKKKSNRYMVGHIVLLSLVHTIFIAIFSIFWLTVLYNSIYIIKKGIWGQLRSSLQLSPKDPLVSVHNLDKQKKASD